MGERDGRTGGDSKEGCCMCMCISQYLLLSFHCTENSVRDC